MKKRARNILRTIGEIFLVLFSLFILLKPQMIFADGAFGTSSWGGDCIYTGTSPADKSQFTVATIQGFRCLIGNVLQVAVTGIGLIGFVMLIVGSFRFLLSGGNAKGTDEGKKTITYAVFGLIVALSSWFILNIVAQFTGVQGILNFTLNYQGTPTQVIHSRCTSGYHANIQGVCVPNNEQCPAGQFFHTTEGCTVCPLGQHTGMAKDLNGKPILNSFGNPTMGTANDPSACTAGEASGTSVQ